MIKSGPRVLVAKFCMGRHDDLELAGHASATVVGYRRRCRRGPGRGCGDLHGRDRRQRDREGRYRLAARRPADTTGSPRSRRAGVRRAAAPSSSPRPTSQAAPAGISSTNSPPSLSPPPTARRPRTAGCSGAGGDTRRKPTHRTGGTTEPGWIPPLDSPSPRNHPDSPLAQPMIAEGDRCRSRRDAHSTASSIMYKTP